MIYLRKLAHLFEHQHLVLTGSFDGFRWIGMTDRHLTLIERHGMEEAINEMKYVVSHVKDSIDPMEIASELDENGCPVLPEGTKTIPAGQDARDVGKILPPRKAYDLVNQTLDKMDPFVLPAGIQDCKEQWLAFRFCAGKLYVRSSEEYQELDQAVEYEFVSEYSTEAIEDGICFAVQTELLRICKEIAGPDMTMSVKRSDTGAMYIGIRTTDLVCVYFCKPLSIKENIAVSEEPTPEANSGAPDNVEPTDPQEPMAETPDQEPAAETSGETEPTQPPSDGDDTGAGPGDEPEPKAKPEPLDLAWALEEDMAERYRVIRDTVRTQMAELEKLRKAVAREAKKALKSTADPAQAKALTAEIKELKAQVTKAEKQRDAAKAALKAVL